MRIRIALTTAVAVLVIPAVLFALFSSTPAAPARVRHEAGSRHRETRSNPRLTSSSQAQKVARAQQVANAKLANFYNAVTKQEEVNFLKEAAYLKAVSAQRAAQQAAAQQAAAQQAAAQQAAAQQAAAAAAAAARAQAAATPAPAPVAAANASDATSADTPDWACIRAHESGDNYSEGGGGAYQFELGTWEGLTGLGTPAEDSPPAVQDAAALKLYSQRGWEPWSTRFVCGL